MLPRLVFWLLMLTLGRVAQAEPKPPPPACRLDPSLDAPIQAAFSVIRENSEQREEFPFRTLNINTAAPADGLRLDLIRDAWVGKVDAGGCPLPGGDEKARGIPDFWSVVQLCKPEGPRRLSCSADALRALLNSDPQKRSVNPAIVLVLTHELSHLSHGDPGAYLSALKEVSRERTQAAKWAALSAACLPPDLETADAQVKRESRADEDAIRMLERLAEVEMRDDEVAGPGGARSLLMGSLTASLMGLREWQAGLLGHRDIPPIETPLEGDDVERFVEWVTDRRLCDVFGTAKGSVLVPIAASDHPLASVRLSSLSLRLASLPTFRNSPPLLERVRTGNAGDLLEKMAAILAVIARDEAEAEVLSSRAFCERVQTSLVPDCAAVPAEFPRAPRQCPELRTKVEWLPLTLQPHSVSLTEDADGLQLGAQDLTFARPLGDGTLLVGARNRLGFVNFSAEVSWFDVPCTPRDAVETSTGALTICEHPLGLLKTSRSAPIAWGHAKNPVFNGEPDEEQSSVRWMGKVGDRHLALFVSGSGISQTIDVTSDEWTTADPWQKQGCEIVGHGMEVGLANGRLTGASTQGASIPRTARFDAEFKRATRFTAWAEPEFLTCGIGPKSPLCLAADGRLVDPEPNPFRIVARVPIRELLRQGNVRHAALCSGAGAVWVLILTEAPGATRAELHRVQGEVNRRMVRRDGIGTASLQCSTDEVDVTFSNGLSSQVVRLNKTGRVRPVRK
ncbi:hypothetical protein ACQKGO_33335 [Corallococcus interemptor]|uniref:hypothetical protein n=1 Tax=Corallococcus interemptor TaxID=2316720 RepID=UPI003CFBDDB7